MFHIDRKRLAEAVGKVAPAAAKNVYGDNALQGILMSHAAHGQLRLIATDLETRVEHSIYTERSEAFEVVVSAKRLTDALKAQKATFVDVGPDHDQLVVGDARLPLLPPDEMPKQPGPGGIIGKVRAASFADSLARAAVAASSDQARPALRAVSLTKDDKGRVVAVGTDSFRLHAISLPFAALTSDVILSLDSVKILGRLLKGQTGAMVLSEADGPGTVAMRLPDKTGVWCRRVEAQVVPWERLVPAPNEVQTLPITDGELAETLREAKALKATIATVTLGGAVRITARNDEETVLERKLEQGWFHEPRSFAVNPGYLLDAINAIPGAGARELGVIGQDVGEGVLKPLVLTDGQSTALVMPIRPPADPPSPPTRPAQEDPGHDEDEGDDEQDADDSEGEHAEEPTPIPVMDREDDIDGAEDDGEYVSPDGTHYFRELGWSPTLAEDAYECCSCEDVFSHTDVFGEYGKRHACWLPAGDTAKADVPTQKQPPAPEEVGAIWHTSWGYDQTNVEFFEVVEVKPASLVLRSIASEVREGRVYPVPGHWIIDTHLGGNHGSPERIKAEAKGYTEKLCRRPKGERLSVRIDDVRFAWPYEGGGKYDTLAAGQPGH